MAKILKVSDVDGQGVLAFDLRHLLPLLGDTAADLGWHVVQGGDNTWFLGELSALKAVDDFAKKVEASESGVQITLRELQNLSHQIHQTVWGTFVGVRPETPWPGVDDMFADDSRCVDRATSKFFDIVEVAIQAMGCAHWFVYCRDAEVRERIRAAFDEVEVIDVGK